MLTLILGIVACVTSSVHSASPTLDKFNIRCSTSCQVYFDGANVGSSTSYALLSAPLSLTAKVVAVDVDNTKPPGSFIASSNKAILSDTTWKCSRTNPTGWQKPDFDDSDWPNATFYEYNKPDPKPFQFNRYDDVHDMSQWIGAGYVYTPGHFYCRKKIPLVLSYYCDNYCRVWVDGVIYPGSIYPYHHQKSVIPDDARVIAFWLDNSWEPVACVAAGTNRGMISDTTFKCTSNNYTNWQQPNFDDSSWPKAVLYGAPGFVDIDPAAEYTSTVDWGDIVKNKYIFCRKTLY